ncbi:hypothetical protein GT020_01370 [Glutamicibacter soli]|uniref:DNA/RNA non-specific endonuclease n=1 Tax=Glutamicibacter soli TaxID=453836 RepID=A0A6L9G2F8_9MICC|nr:DNA/RNA non-specific endonuclease [Glutamicibacter soli]NAZ14720.1 hypothetical protein [Glutamicibacter soli]
MDRPARTGSALVPAPAPVPAPAATTPGPATTQAPAVPGPTDTGVPASAYGPLADGGFLARIGSGLHLDAAALAARELDLSAGPQPLPGVRLQRLRKFENELQLHGTLAIPFVDDARVVLRVRRDGSTRVSGAIAARLRLAALGNPRLAVGLDENGVLTGTLAFADLRLLPPGTGAQATGSGELLLAAGRLSGTVHADLAYPRVGTASADVGFSPEGAPSGAGSLSLTPPFMDPVSAALAVDAEGNLTAEAQLDASAQRSPLPGLTLTGGQILLGYNNGVPSLVLTDFAAAYAGVGSVSIASLELSGRNPQFSGRGTLVASIPGMQEVTGALAVRGGRVSGSLRLGVDDFPQGLPLRNGQITVLLGEDGQLGFNGRVTVALGPAGVGELRAAYQAGVLDLGAQVQLSVPGLGPVQVVVAYSGGELTGSVDAPINPELVPGLGGAVHISYAQDRWSGETTLAYSADDGKLSGTITVTVAQTEDGSLQLGGSGQVRAQLLPNLAGTLTATILPEGGVDVSGTIEVTDPVPLFDEQRVEKELFSHSQNIPLWAILVAVIRIRAGVRAGIGPGVFRNITVTGSYTLGSTNADPSFAVTGELYIPAFVEGYVAFGAGLGLDVVLGSLTGGIEAVGTAGIYGAVSVIPELRYADGQWSISGVATLAAGARLSLDLNAWAEVEAFWVTVWENSWKLASVTMPIGPDLALQAKMDYVFGRPDPPQLEYSSSDIDAESLIQSAMPEDGPAPTGAREALANKAEWKGALREQRAAALPPELAAQAQQSEPAPAAPPKPPPVQGPPPGPAAAGAPNSAHPSSPAAAAPAGGAPAGPPPPGDPVSAAATPDPTVPTSVPPEQLPTTGQPRFAGPVSLAMLDEPPVPVPRSKDQEHEDLAAAGQAIDLAASASDGTESLAAYFPKIKNRFRLTSLGFEGDFDTGFDILAEINPALRRTPSAEPLRGTGLLDTAGDGHATTIDFATDTISGDPVGTEMKADPLGPDHPLGTPPSGSQAVMGLLGEQYIRGHLLNQNLGGPGENRNLFPITRSANAVHETGIESTVKDWVNNQRYWVSYKVSVTGDRSLKTDQASGQRYLNSSLSATAQILDLNLKPWRTVTATINSTFDAKSSVAEVGDTTKPLGHGESPGLREARPADLAAAVLVQSDGKTSFPAPVRADLAALRQRYKAWKNVRARLEQAEGVGPATSAVLEKAYTQTASGYDRLSVQLADSVDKRLLTLAVGNWHLIRAALGLP